jgi:hypothetical protein
VSDDAIATDTPFDLGDFRDIWSEPRWAFVGCGPDRRASFGLPEGATKEQAFAEEGMKVKHPDLTSWTVLKFEKWIHVTKEDR